MVTGTRGWSYQPPLDGIRAVAVAAVFAYHLDAGWAEGGYLGVDAFFVLSGFLITSLLLSEFARNCTISLTAFWARRARRLLPALFLMLVAVGVYAAFLAESTQLESLRADMFATLFYGANWRFIGSGQSYFALFTDASPLRHAWSLAIEEQFYLVWPLVTVGCLRLARGRHGLLAAVCAAGTAASMLTMTRLYDADDPSRAYYGTDGRAQLLLIGALLAIVLAHWTPQRVAATTSVHVVGAIGAAYVVWSFATVGDTDAWMYRGGYALFAVAVALLITSVVQPDRTPLRVGLSLAPVVWLGRISYGVYLWHWPVIVVASPARTGLDGASLTLLRVGATLALAALSFYLVELPIRERRVLTGRFALAAWPALFLAGALVVVSATRGATELPAYYRTTAAQVIRTGNVEAPRFGAVSPPGRVLLVGDSIATSFYRGLADAGATKDLAVSVAAYPGCGLLRGVATLGDGSLIDGVEGCDQGVSALQRDTAARVQPDLIVWLSVWEITDRLVDGRHIVPGTPEGDRELGALIEEAAARLRAHGQHLLILVPSPPTPNAFLPHYTYDERMVRMASLKRLLTEEAQRYPQTTSVVDLTPIVCPQGPPCPEVVNGMVLRPDGSHFATEGARYVADRLVPLLQQRARPPTDSARRALDSASG